MWGLSLGRGMRRTSRAVATSTAGQSGRKKKPAAVLQAARQTMESLESRVFLHAGVHLTPTASFPTNGQQKVSTSTSVMVTFSTDVNAATVKASSFELRDENNNVVPSTYYLSGTKTVVLDPVGTLATSNNYYTAILKGGSGSVKDIAGNGLDEDVRIGFTTGTPQFTQTQVLGGLSGPVAMQFASDGRIFVAERSGLVKVFDNINDTTPSTVADLRTQVHNFWDRGLLGMALHPNFPAKPYIYLLYTFDSDIGGTAPKYGTPDTTSDPGPDATGQGAKVSGRLSRIAIAGNTMVAGSEFVLVNDWAQQFPSHSIGSVAFGQDGALYASGGDGASFNYADYGQTGNPFNDPVQEGGAVRSQDLRSPNDPTTLDGSIIRINPDTGAALPDNPLFATGNDANAKRIIAYGFRNPFRITFRPGTNEIWSGDVGMGTWEEINRINFSSTKVSNYGWPAYEGPNRQPGFDGLNLPLLEALYDEGPTAVVTPFFAYQHSEKVVPGSTEPTGGSSISSLAFYDGANYPGPYQGALFFGDYSRNTMYVMYPGLNGELDPATRQTFKVGGIGPVQMMAGPNGDIFVVDLNNKIIRFSYNSTNRPPTAAITTDKVDGSAPLTVQFSGANSSDPDPIDTLSYAWDLDGDGQYDDSTAVSPTYTYTAPGTYVVKLRVTDNRGANSIAQVNITAGNNAPVPTITSPLVSIRWKVGDTINFAGGAIDLQDGTIAAAGLKWELILRHESSINPGTYHEHHVQDFVGVSSGSFIAPDHEYPSSLELRLTATDSGGLSSTQTIVLLPQTTTLNFTSNVVGARISFNGELVAAPFSRTVIVGSDSSIVATTPQIVNGVIYNFVSWSDNGAATHNIIAGPNGGTYHAIFVGAATVPAPWQSHDIGTYGLPGSSTFEPVKGEFAVAGAGGDIWGTEDSFRFVNQQVTGDVQIVARVKSLQNTDPSAKAGIQIRQSLDANSANVQIDVEGSSDWGEFHVRPTAGAETSTAAYPNISTPHWLKLTRVGNVFTAYRSTDGQTWFQTNQTTVAMTGTIYVGLAVCSHDVATLNTAVFDNVAVTSLANTVPTIITPASAALAPTGKTANLAVAADDDGTEANLKYTWAMVSGPAAASFLPNGNNTSKNSVATFTAVGTYVLRVTVADLLGKSVSSDVTINVAQVLTAVTVTPAAALLAAGQTQQNAAIARDQFGNALATQPTFDWALDAGSVGTISATGLYNAPATGTGAATVRATTGGKSGTATITVTAAPSGDVTTGLVHRWKFDESIGTSTADSVGPNNGILTNGSTWATGQSGSALNLDGVDDYVATASDLATTLSGTATLTAWLKTTQIGTNTFWSTPGIAGIERHWHDNDIFWGILNDQGRIGIQAGDAAGVTSTTAINDGVWHHLAFTRNAGTGQLQVYVDGVLQGSVVGAVGAKTTPFSSIGRIENSEGPATYLKGGLDDVRVYSRILSAEEVLAVKANPGTTTPVPPPPPANTAPTVATAAKVTPTAPVAGTAAALSVLGADNGGEANLKYTWSIVSAPAGAVAPTFGANGTNAAKNTTVTFTTAGAYTLRATISDGSLSNTSNVTMTVTAANTAPTVATAAKITPTAPTAGTAATVSVLGADNGGEANLLYTWSVVTAPTGAVAPTFAANGTNAAKTTAVSFTTAGTYTLRATISDGSLSVTSNVTFTVAANPAPTVATAAKITPTAPLVGVPAVLSALGADNGGETNLKYTWSVVTAPAGASAPIFSVNGTNAAKNANVTFATAGSYTLRCTISDGTSSVTSNVSATVAVFSSAKINFQPSSAATVSGYTVDSGATYGVRTSSLSFGWNTSHTTSVFDRAKNTNQLLDTTILLNAGAKWEIAVPNGTYSVKVSVGDANGAATNTIRAEGTSVFSAIATATNVFQNKTVSVVVTDGKLTIDNNSAAANTTRLNYIEITKTA